MLNGERQDLREGCRPHRQPPAIFWAVAPGSVRGIISLSISYRFRALAFQWPILLLGMTLPVKMDEAFFPMRVGLFRTKGVTLRTSRLSQTIKQLRRLARACLSVEIGISYTHGIASNGVSQKVCICINFPNQRSLGLVRIFLDDPSLPRKCPTNSKFGNRSHYRRTKAIMKRSIIVTDLTRFNNREIVCTAGADRSNGECIRPMPYLQSKRCKELNILPGAILSGEFRPSPDREGPHQEDHQYSNLTFGGPCTSSEFKTALKYGLFVSVEEGFEAELEDRQKHIPFGHTVARSIITILVSPRDVEIIEDSYKPGKIKLNFTDGSGRKFQYIAITDLGFHDYAVNHHAQNQLNALNRWIRAQEEVLLRLGLSRRFQANDERDGYWLQANGIYTFPEYHKDIRSYQ